MTLSQHIYGCQALEADLAAFLASKFEPAAAAPAPATGSSAAVSGGANAPSGERQLVERSCALRLSIGRA